LTLTWSAVPGVTLYYVQIVAFVGAGPTGVSFRSVYSGNQSGTSVSLTFTASDAGEWSVCAVGSDGTHGAFSPWWGFIWSGKGSTIG
jgi:hypothetical protein